ncbi:MAG TPA: hypothetical protein VFC84_08785 [Desulfosporosinus sp.]|nr:hypothetical protein [Desulfosporosinus sp.]
MANNNLKTSMKTSILTNLSLNSTVERVQASADTSGVTPVNQYRLKRTCTKKDHQLKAIMEEHLEKQIRHYTNN